MLLLLISVPIAVLAYWRLSDDYPVLGGLIIVGIIVQVVTVWQTNSYARRQQIDEVRNIDETLRSILLPASMIFWAATVLLLLYSFF
jgi:membrane protein YdbS with pleckstrin-like domain